MRNKIITTFGVGLIIGGLLLGGYSAYSAIQSQVGVNIVAADVNPNVWVKWASITNATSDNQSPDTASFGTGFGVPDVHATLFGINPSGNLDRMRISLAADDLAATGILPVQLYLFDGTNSDRLRSALPNIDNRGVTATTALSIPSIAFPHVFDSTGWDRVRDANTVNNTTGTGLQATAILGSAPGGTFTIVGTRSGAIVTGSNPTQLGPQNSESTSAANSAVTITIAAAADVRANLHKITARCDAGTATLTVDDDVTQIWSTSSGAVGTTNFTETWNPGLTSAAVNTTMDITLSTCGAGNVGTLAVHASRF